MPSPYQWKFRLESYYNSREFLEDGSYIVDWNRFVDKLPEKLKEAENKLQNTIDVLDNLDIIFPLKS